jgi:uncharacterized metal-binding protein YceD (DUF177 family)
MSNRREYEIPFVGLKPGIHEFNYRITDKFFEAYQQQDFKNCDTAIKLSLDKKNGFMLLKFELSGKMEVICDRCGNSLPIDLWDEFNILVKLVEEPDVMNRQEEDPDVYYISRNESHLHIADWIYEFINLSIPLQRMCNDEEIGGKYCNKEVLKMLRNMESKKDEPANPLWQGLEQFKSLDE